MDAKSAAMETIILNDEQQTKKKPFSVENYMITFYFRSFMKQNI